MLTATRMKRWFDARGMDYIQRRGRVLMHRYGISSSGAEDRVIKCTSVLTQNGCRPTYPAPGSVVGAHSRLFRQLQEAGAEITVHGYHHVDLRSYPTAKAEQQLVRAVRTFEKYGIQVHGFRCPYLNCTDELADSLPEGMFKYSSNTPVQWDVLLPDHAGTSNVMQDGLERIYHPESAQSTVCVPRLRSRMIEIPVCLPDDLELYDALCLPSEDIAELWGKMLTRVHRRGELMTLLFHLELAVGICQPVVWVVQAAKRLQPSVWIARLADIADWWREKSSFSVQVSDEPAGLHIAFKCSPRATILVRGLNAGGSEGVWEGRYYRLENTALSVPNGTRPFVGLSADIPEHIATFLTEQGYIVDTTESATQCATYIDAAALSRLTGEVNLVNYIETSSAPLVRYWRWPAGAKCALAVTGDLDALTLLDYVSRAFLLN